MSRRMPVEQWAPGWLERVEPKAALAHCQGHFSKIPEPLWFAEAARDVFE